MDLYMEEGLHQMSNYHQLNLKHQEVTLLILGTKENM